MSYTSGVSAGNDIRGQVWKIVGNKDVVAGELLKCYIIPFDLWKELPRLIVIALVGACGSAS